MSFWMGLAAFSILLIGVGAWFLWARGAIPQYTMAWAFTLGLNLFVVGFALMKSRGVLSRAVVVEWAVLEKGTGRTCIELTNSQ